MTRSLQRASLQKTIALTAGAFLLPVAVVAAMSLGPFSEDALPEIVMGEFRSEQAAALLAELSQTMISMSLGTGFVSFWIYRQPMRGGFHFIPEIFFLAGMFLALISLYSGLRFKHDMAQQLRFAPLDFERIKGRLTWEGGALLLQVCMMNASAVLHYLHIDRRPNNINR